MPRGGGEQRPNGEHDVNDRPGAVDRTLAALRAPALAVHSGNGQYLSMRAIDLNRLDLNLLKVFVMIHEEGNVTSAGARLGLAQSSISHALTRLRTTLQDPLFVRCANGMVPTSYAELIFKPIREFLDGLGAALDRGRDFDSMVSERSFTIAMTDLGEAAFLPALMSRLKDSAPNVSISVLQLRPAMYREKLEAGVADLVLGLLPDGDVDLFQQRLFDAELACFFRSGHPVQQNLTLQTFLEARHLVMGPDVTSERYVQRALGPKASQRNVALNVQHYLTALRVLLKTDLIAVMPKIVGNNCSLPGALVHLPCPFEIEPLTLRQMWHARSQHDAGSRWLRSELSLLFRVHRTDQEDDVQFEPSFVGSESDERVFARADVATTETP